MSRQNFELDYLDEVLYQRANMRRALTQLLESDLIHIAVIEFIEEKLWLESATLSDYCNPWTLKSKLLRILEREKTGKGSKSLRFYLITLPA